MTGRAVLREVALYLKIAGTTAMLLSWGRDYSIGIVVGFLLVVIAYLIQYVASVSGAKPQTDV